SQHNHCERHASERGHSVIGSESMAGARQRPKRHYGEESATGPQNVNESAAAEIHESISDEKSRIEKGFDLIGNGNLLANLANRNGEGLPIQVADGDGSANDKGNSPAEFGSSLNVPVQGHLCSRSAWER